MFKMHHSVTASRARRLVKLNKALCLGCGKLHARGDALTLSAWCNACKGATIVGAHRALDMILSGIYIQ